MKVAMEAYRIITYCWQHAKHLWPERFATDMKIAYVNSAQYENDDQLPFYGYFKYPNYGVGGFTVDTEFHRAAEQRVLQRYPTAIPTMLGPHRWNDFVQRNPEGKWELR